MDNTLDFAKWLEENTTVIYGEKITLYRYDGVDGVGNYILDDIYQVYKEKCEVEETRHPDYNWLLQENTGWVKALSNKVDNIRWVSERIAKCQERYSHFKEKGNDEKMNIYYGKISALDDVRMMLMEQTNPVDDIVESEEKKSWFDENVRFVEWFKKSGLNPFTTSYEEAHNQFKEQTKEVGI